MTHKFKNVSMLLFGAMFFLVACQNDAVQEVVDNHTPTEIAGVKAAYTTKVSVDDAKRITCCMYLFKICLWGILI